MSYETPTDAYARRWQAILAENRVLQKEHMDLISSWTPPFSVQQIAQLKASAARSDKISLELAELVDEWAADARSM
jgi:hypothetical protein